MCNSCAQDAFQQSRVFACWWPRAYVPLPYTSCVRSVVFRCCSGFLGLRVILPASDSALLSLFLSAATEAFLCASCPWCFAQGALFSGSAAEALLCLSNLLNLLAGCGWTISLGYAPWCLGCRTVAKMPSTVAYRHGRDVFPGICSPALYCCIFLVLRSVVRGVDIL